MLLGAINHAESKHTQTEPSTQLQIFNHVTNIEQHRYDAHTWATPPFEAKSPATKLYQTEDVWSKCHVLKPLTEKREQLEYSEGP